ncbi:MAG: alpha/beta hydrolase [Chloroflexi bacterium]|nr:alpha/beta hydrolase [Chloroflexota bacterium]MBV9894906.1 alpha/beta hydrolase [Chloroflexota bacterium]
MTWADWHKAYDDPSSALSARLRVVQRELRQAIDRCPAGRVRLVSVCAGQGHDVIGALQGHPRCNDVNATLIEVDDDNVRAARERIAAAGLANVRVIGEDASLTDVYDGLVPADIILVCGLFGNLSDEDIHRTIKHLPMLCAAGASVLWTRGGFLADHIRAWFVQAGFAEVSYTELPSHSIGANRFVGTPRQLESGVRLFTFKESWTLRATEDSLDIRGLRLHYRAWGNPDGPVLVLLHGLRGSAEVWWSLAAALDTWHLIALDQRGRGASDWAPDADYSHVACLLDLEEFVDKLQLERFALLGHSAGGAVALGYTLKHPERVDALVLEDIGPLADGQSRWTNVRQELAQLPLTFASWDATFAYQRERNPRLSEQRLKNSLRYFFRELPGGSITWKYDLAGLLRFDPARNSGFDPWSEMGRVRCPMLLIRGGRSKVVSDEAVATMRRANPHLQCIEIPDAGHNVHLENAAAFNRELAEFLAEHRRD